MSLLLLLACETGSAPAQASDPVLPFRLVPAGEVRHPTAIAAPPGPGHVLYVTEQEGRIWKVANGAATQVADLSDRITSGGERGLLGLAFHPSWPTDPRIFVNYTRTEGKQLRTRIASYVLPPGAGTLDLASEVEIIAFDQPFSNHNSGALAFGRDGYLYAGVGDGGSAGDPNQTGQSLADLLGSILRLDVSVVPYKVPPENPFVGQAGARPEVWAWGVRNPWGMHFDGDTLWFADVGQNTWEEVNRGQKGANYGWNVMEGNHCYKEGDCSAAGLTLPIAEYNHTLGQSVTGGVVYRGPSIPVIDGRYIYADFAAGLVFAVSTQGGPAALLGRMSANPSTFGEDGSGEVYVGDYGGKILKIAP